MLNKLLHSGSPGPSFARIFSIGLVLTVTRYLIVAGLAHWYFWTKNPERFRHRRLHKQFPKRWHVARELRYSCVTALVFAAVACLSELGRRHGVLQIYGTVSMHGWAYFGASVLALIVLHDAYFYWTHRAMHHRLLYRRFHRVHHLSTNPSPWAAYAFAPGEALVHALFAPLAALVMPVHPVALFLWLSFMIVRNVLGHLGIELFGRGFIRHPLGRLNTTTTHHSLHHRHFKSNFGLYFTWWDEWMGTVDPTYEETFDAITERGLTDARRGSASPAATSSL